jgi:phosphodiesterase/alkaline phosphatase D-like protein
MEDFLSVKLRDSVDSGQAWRILGNQIPMARTHVPDVANRLARDAFTRLDSLPDSYNNLSRLGKFDLPLYLDTWDGYPVAREKLYDLCRESGANDLIVLTGDSHAFWANELFNNANQSMGVELGTTGVTSPGDFESYGPQGAVAIDRLVSEHNHEVVWTDCTRRGFIKLILTQTSAQADYIAVDTVSSEKYVASLVRRMEITKKDGGLVFED